MLYFCVLRKANPLDLLPLGTSPNSTLTAFPLSRGFKFNISQLVFIPQVRIPLSLLILPNSFVLLGSNKNDFRLFLTM